MHDTALHFQFPRGIDKKDKCVNTIGSCSSSLSNCNCLLYSGSYSDQLVRENASLMRENQATRGIITQPTDGPPNCQQPPEDIKPFVEDVKANFMGNVKPEPMPGKNRP